MDTTTDILSLLERLRSEQERIANAIESLEMLLGGVKQEPKKSALRAPRGYLKSRVREALDLVKGPVPVTELREQLETEGYDYATGQSLYSSIFSLTKRDADFKVTDSGVSLAGKGTPEKKSRRKSRKKDETPASLENDGQAEIPVERDSIQGAESLVATA